MAKRYGKTKRTFSEEEINQVNKQFSKKSARSPSKNRSKKRKLKRGYRMNKGLLLLYPLRNTTTDPTSTLWRNNYGTAAGYSFKANVGIRMPGGTPITDMENMFASGTFNDPDIATWNVSTVTNMRQLFGSNNTFNQDISAWNVSNVTNMEGMFLNASSFNNGGFQLSKTLDNPNDYGTTASDRFGFSVAVSDSYAIVGARGEDDAGGTDSGKAYIYNNTTGALVHTLDNPNDYGTTASDLFGQSVAITDSYAIVSASGEDDAGGNSSGKAYIFNTVTGALLHTLDNPNPYGTTASDLFGQAVAISDTYAMVSASGEDDASGNSSGKAYIYNNSTGALLHTLDNPNPYGTSANDDFGRYTIGISDAYAIVGASGEDEDGDSASGKAYIFNTVTGALLHTLDNPDAFPSVSDRFGYSVAISDTYAIVGARNEDDADGTDSGKAYIYNNSTGALLHTLDNPNAYDTSQTDRFGDRVAISDSYAIVGAWYEDDDGGSASGKAYIFDTVTGALLHTLDNPNPYDTGQGDNFGRAIAISDTRAIVGAYNEDDAGGTSSGKSYIYSVKDISSWDTSAVTNMNSMFKNATAFNQQDLSGWNVSLIPSYPTDFDTNTPLFDVAEHPVWGTNGGS